MATKKSCDKFIGKEIDEETSNKVYKKLSDRKGRLLFDQPFYGVLVAMMNFIEDIKIPTMATNGTQIMYNPHFVMSMSDDEITGVILHEISHCVYMHTMQKRVQNRQHRLYNAACDYVVNLEVKGLGYKLPDFVLYDNKFDNMNSDQVYDILLEGGGNGKGKCKDKGEDKDGDDGLETLDDHIINHDESAWEDMKEKIATAYEIASMQDRGKIPDGVARWIKKLRKPLVPWERVFHRYVGQALSRDDYSYVRVSKRFVGQDIYLPDLRSQIIGSVVIAIDTSGSMDERILAQVAAEVRKIGHLINELVVMTCDADVHEVVKVTKFEDFLSKIKMKGGGGTDFKPVFKKVADMKIEPELLIYLTDSYGDFPKKQPNYPVLWCVTCEEAMKNIPWGQTVFIPRDHD